MERKNNEMSRQQFLTRRWNNWLTLILGLPTLVYAVIYLSTSLLPDFQAFIGMAVLGAVY